MEIEEAKKLIEQESKDRAKLCGEELKALLEKHNCEMVVGGVFQGNNLQTQIIVKSK